MDVRKWAGAALCALTLSASAAAQTPKVLTIALPASLTTLDPHMSASIGTDLSVLSQIYPALILRGPDLKLQPSLAKSWKAVDDLTWRFELVDGATFADGEKLDATAVKWNLDRVRDPKTNARIKSWFDLVKDVVVVNPTTIDVKMSAPYPAFADQLSMFFMVPPDWATKNNPATQTSSGGQYVMSENVPGDHMTLVPNMKYWGQKPAFDKVVYRTIPEVGGRMAALNAGEIDFATQIPVTEIDRLKKEGKINADSVASTRTALLKLNPHKPPLDNKLFRQALNYAIDKEGIDESLFGGRADVAPCQLMTKDYFGYNPSLKAYPYDPDKARDLLKKSGVNLSQEVELEVPVAVYTQGQEVTQAIAAELQDVGLKVRISELTFGAFMDKQLKAKNLAQLAYQTLAWPTLDADGMLTMFEPNNVYDYWDNKDFGALIAGGRATTDPARRMDFYNKATALMCEEAPVVFLFNQPLTYALSKRVSWRPRGDDWIRAQDFTLLQ